jgi:hypothetical protein
MCNLIQFHLYVAVCNPGSYMQLNLRNLDTRTGYHKENPHRFGDRGRTKKPSEFRVGTALKRGSNCLESARPMSDERAILRQT